MMQGYTYGLEAWGEYRVAPWWRLSASLHELDEHLTLKPGATRLFSMAEAGDVTCDAELRYVSARPDPHAPAYAELDTRIGWNINQHVQLSLSGFNLLLAHHLEFPASEASAVPRNFLADLRFRF
jgi:iron complex outermembrane receptor protein